MGYTTDFIGKLTITPELTDAQVAYINQFSNTRRMKRKASLCRNMHDPLRKAVGLPMGDGCGYFVGGLGSFGQDCDKSVLDSNSPPEGQPGLWCQWTVTKDSLEWNGGEKFYSYVPWLEYLIEHFFKRWNVTLNGQINWQGEERGDTGTILVQGNMVTASASNISDDEDREEEETGEWSFKITDDTMMNEDGCAISLKGDYESLICWDLKDHRWLCVVHRSDFYPCFKLFVADYSEADMASWINSTYKDMKVKRCTIKGITKDNHDRIV